MQEPATVYNLLQNSLNPSLTNQAHAELLQMRNRNGFSGDLLIIADNPKNNIFIRQSALVTLKNLIKDETEK